MALFQPTNVIPSSFTVGVVDAEKETVQLSWQINGNSPMTAFSVAFYENTDATESATAKQVATIAKTSEGIPTGGFYGTDRFGKPQMFTWRDPNNRTWKSLGLDNGNEYKFKITQYWEGGEVEQIEYSAFATRSAPKVEIKRSGADFTETTDFGKGSTLPASIGYFVGVYSQAQGAPVREVRWQVATWVNGREGDILADTGDVDTSTLCYSFNGFFIEAGRIHGQIHRAVSAERKRRSFAVGACRGYPSQIHARGLHSHGVERLSYFARKERRAGIFHNVGAER